MSVNLFKQAQEQVRDLPQQGNPVQVTKFDPADWEAFVAKIMTQYPDLEPDVEAVVNAGKTASGQPQKLAVFRAERDRAQGLHARNVTLYSTGKIVWTNLAPVAL